MHQSFKLFTVMAFHNTKQNVQVTCKVLSGYVFDIKHCFLFDIFICFPGFKHTVGHICDKALPIFTRN